MFLDSLPSHCYAILSLSDMVNLNTKAIMTDKFVEASDHTHTLVAVVSIQTSAFESL